MAFGIENVFIVANQSSAPRRAGILSTPGSAPALAAISRPAATGQPVDYHRREREALMSPAAVKAEGAPLTVAIIMKYAACEPGMWLKA